MKEFLPIEEHLPAIREALQTRRCAVIQAPPGAGKTTRVSLALLSEPWCSGKKIILLEPRRLAAITCAAHMASILGESAGETVGYQIRLDRKTGSNTRIEVVTEGIFTRKIQSDPSLEDTALVIFDEFHERSIHSDLGLALCLESFEALREDLRILVMSATLDTKGISGLMGDAPVIASKGRSFPVDTLYLPAVNRQKRSLSIEAACEMAVHKALRETRGDILVFLPGVGEIKSLLARLKDSLDPDIRILPLYGDLPFEDQKRVFRTPAPGVRKLVLSTSIAETSVTIDNISVVIDSGLMRAPRFSAGTGLTLLSTLPVSRASADQRRGRAGRTGPGTCYRLWSEYDHGLLKPFTRPEIQSADLSTLALELSAWGVDDPGALKWLDPPDPSAYESAKDLLKWLGALDEKGRITAHGKKMAGSGLHPRLSHMVIKANQTGRGRLACRIAACLGERDFLHFDDHVNDPDIGLRLLILEEYKRKKSVSENQFRVSRGIIQRIYESERKLMQEFHITSTPPSSMRPEEAGALLANAYPDRVAKKREDHEHTFLTASGKGLRLGHIRSVSTPEYIVAIHLDGSPSNAKVFLFAPLSREAFFKELGHGFMKEGKVYFDKITDSVRAEETLRFGAIPLETRSMENTDPERTLEILMEAIRKKGIHDLPWTKNLTSLKYRAMFLKEAGVLPDLPDLSDKSLTESLSTWLGPFLSGIKSFKELKEMDLEPAFLYLLPWESQIKIEALAPTHMVVPSGSRLPLVYRDGNGVLKTPVLSVRLQEMFGLCETPQIAGQAITLHLLSPAGRPVQITRDLKSFWKNAYKDVKKDLMGRYPKHYWPEDPVAALPTNRAKKRTS